MTGRSVHEGLRVGFVLFVALVILVAGLYVIAFRFWDTIHFTTYFSETGGLRVGAPVWIGGVEVGSVADIGFASQELRSAGRKEIEVVLAIGRRFCDRIREDSVCSVKTRGLLGEKIVTVQGGSREKSAVPYGGEIASEEGKDLQDAITTAGAGVDRTAAAAVLALEELRQILVDVRTQRGILGKLIYSDEFYRDTIARLDGVVDEVKKELAGLNATLREEISTLRKDASGGIGTLEKELRLTAEETRETLAEVRKEVGEIGLLVDAVREGKGSAGMLVGDEEFAATFRKAMENLSTALERFASVMGKVDAGEGTLGMLMNDRSAYTSMRDLFEGVQESWLLRGAVRQAEADGRERRIKRWAEGEGREEEEE